MKTNTDISLQLIKNWLNSLNLVLHHLSVLAVLAT